VRYLAVVERGYRGSVETQFADVLYLVRELNRQFGGLDLSLRGLAVTYAVAAAPVAPAVGVDALPDPRASLRTLLDEGVAVTVADADLAAAGLPGDVPLLPGVVRGAARWSDYRAVWFL